MDMTQYNDAMRAGYWARWTPMEQARIDADIEANRKADADFVLPGLEKGAEVQVKQLSHAFIFGAHIFNFDQLGSQECNEKYKSLYGTLFNSATIAFYWQPFEPQEGHPRFAGSEKDTPEFWASCAEPKLQAHWRRPAPDPIVEFCERKGIRRHGHPMIWANSTWHYPRFIIEKLPKEILSQLLSDVRCGANITMQSPNVLAEQCPEFVEYLNRKFDERIQMLAAHYGSRINSWDVCNESAEEVTYGRFIPGAKLCYSSHNRLPMPADYTYRAFQMAQKSLPPEIKLNINDYHLHPDYVRQVKDLQERGCKIDILGAQMHLFNPQQCLDIADGVTDLQAPASIRKTMGMLSETGLPIHLSEITITAPHNDKRGQAIQAVITRNLYRLWFSLKPMMGITWWNVVDDCGAPGEPSVSGLYTRQMEPKPSALVLQDLIQNEWKTNLELKADEAGRIAFRGFRGDYLLSWKDKNGTVHQETRTLN